MQHENPRGAPVQDWTFLEHREHMAVKDLATWNSRGNDTALSLWLPLAARMPTWAGVELCHVLTDTRDPSPGPNLPSLKSLLASKDILKPHRERLAWVLFTWYSRVLAKFTTVEKPEWSFEISQWLPKSGHRVFWKCWVLPSPMNTHCITCYCNYRFMYLTRVQVEPEFYHRFFS